MDKREKKSIVRQFARFTVPAVVGMVVSSLYTVVDGIFVGRGVGGTALAAVNIVFPFIMLQIALTMLVAIGGANRYSFYMGQGRHDDAQQVFRLCMGLLVVISVVVGAVALLFGGPLCRLFGADDALLPMSKVYLRWVALFGIPYMPGLGLSIFVRNDGAPRTEMLGTLCGALTNIVLDWLFIMVFGWGLAGAAIATGIGQWVSVGVFCTHLLRKKGRLRLGAFRWDTRQSKRILYNGLPSFLMEFSQSVITLSFNLAIAARLGNDGVAAYSVVMYICSIFNMVLSGVVQGAQPIVSYNHGRGNAQNVRAVYRLGVGTSLCLTLVFYGVLLLFGTQLAGIFLPAEPALAALAADMMHIYFIGFFPVGITLMNILYFQATGREVPSIAISLLRCIGFVQVFLLVLPPLVGTAGIFWALLCGEVCNAMLSLVLHKVVAYAPPAALRKAGAGAVK